MNAPPAIDRLPGEGEQRAGSGVGQGSIWNGDWSFLAARFDPVEHPKRFRGNQDYARSWHGVDSVPA